jgi:hypothetical protein
VASSFSIAKKMSDPARKSFSHLWYGSVTLPGNYMHQDSDNTTPCDRSNDSSKRAKGHSIVSTNAAASVGGKRRKLCTSTAKESTADTTPLQDRISDPLLKAFEKNLPQDLVEASRADDLFVDDQDKIRGNFASTENNGSRPKLSRLHDFVFDALAEVDDEEVDGDFLFDTKSSMRRLSATVSENARPRRQQNQNPDIQSATPKPSFLIWKRGDDRPANLGLPQFPLLVEEEEGEIAVAEDGTTRYMVIPPDPTTTTPGYWNSFDFTNTLKIATSRGGANVSMQLTPSWIRLVDKLMPNIIFSIATVSPTSFPFRIMHAIDDHTRIAGERRTLLVSRSIIILSKRTDASDRASRAVQNHWETRNLPLFGSHPSPPLLTVRKTRRVARSRLSQCATTSKLYRLCVCPFAISSNHQVCQVLELRHEQESAYHNALHDSRRSQVVQNKPGNRNG